MSDIYAHIFAWLTRAGPSPVFTSATLSPLVVRLGPVVGGEPAWAAKRLAAEAKRKAGR